MLSILSECKRLCSLGVVGLALCASIVSCQGSHNKTYTTLRGEVFHTFYAIQYDLEQDYTPAVDSTFKVFSHSLNPFDSLSMISDINKNRSMQTDSMLRFVIRTAAKVSEATQGSYDVSCSPLINLWGFGFEKRDSIAPHQIDSVRQLVGYQRIHLRGDSLIKEDPRMQLNLSSLSKGYCSDLVADMLAKKGAKNYMVELGGEIAYQGLNPEGKHWTIGINKPIEDSIGMTSEFQVVIGLTSERGAVATSGNYRNFKVINGKRYAHTIDPKTGYPIQTDVLSATILAPTCILADALATACMTKKSEEIPALIAKFPDVEYMLILGGKDGKYQTKMSPGFEMLIVHSN